MMSIHENIIHKGMGIWCLHSATYGSSAKTSLSARSARSTFNANNDTASDISISTGIRENFLRGRSRSRSQQHPRSEHMQGARCAGAWRGAAARALSGRGGGVSRLLEDAAALGEPARPDGPLRWATQPYAARPDARAALDPRDSTVLLFPGQGSQRVGMGLRLATVPAARRLYELASEVVGWDVWRTCTVGPPAELEERCQTCVLVTALAALERAREERPAALERVRAAAGFSLGEVAALAYAGALPLEAALRLVELRAAAMRAAAAARPGGMLTVWLAADARLDGALAAAREAAREAAPETPVCTVANYLYPGCRVVAGDEAALRWLEAEGGAWGVRRAARVRVAGAFHTALMEPAGAAVREAAARLEVRAPRLRVVSGVDGRAYSCAGSVRRGLARGVCAPVRWEQVLQTLYSRPRGSLFPLTLALGPGGALRATLRQVNARAWDGSLQVEV